MYDAESFGECEVVTVEDVQHLVQENKMSPDFIIFQWTRARDMESVIFNRRQESTFGKSCGGISIGIFLRDISTKSLIYLYNHRACCM